MHQNHAQQPIAQMPAISGPNPFGLAAVHQLQADLPEQAAVQMPPGIAAWVFSVAMSPDGKWLASTRGNGRITLWDVATWRILAQAQHQEIVLGVAFSPDGTVLASGGHDRTLQLWRIAE